ncbi:MAG: polysaccharide deacetylase family protein [bacterium]|nr:polysaccharide deacetylase family protein [bacterium]
MLTLLGMATGYTITQPELLMLMRYNPEAEHQDRESIAHSAPQKVKPVPSEGAPVGSVRVPIIVYHSVRPYFFGQTRQMREFDVSPELFDRQLAYLRDNNYTVISFDALVNYLQKVTPLPDKPVVLNFDDGWKNQYTYAFPILKKYGMTATFFVFTNAIGHKNYLSWDNLHELEDAGMTIADHTRSHPYLFKITDAAQLRDEIIESKKVLEDHLDRPVSLFAFPFGYDNPAALHFIKEARYTAARMGAYGIDHTSEGLYRLKSVQVATDMARFARDLGSVPLVNTRGDNRKGNTSDVGSVISP